MELAAIVSCCIITCNAGAIIMAGKVKETKDTKSHSCPPLCSVQDQSMMNQVTDEPMHLHLPDYSQ